MFSEEPRYRVADVSRAPAGGGLAVLYSRDVGTARLVRSEVAGLLDGVSEFRTLDDHARALAGDRIGRQATVRRELERLAREGFLVTPPEPPSGTASVLPPISTLVVPTCGRVATLERTLKSYLVNAAEAGRRIAVAVANDSPQAACHVACTDMLRGLARQFGTDIAYAAPADTRAFATKLAAEACVDPGVAAFACLGSPTSGLITAGANRNTLLLHASCEPLLSTDDDIVCRPAPARDADGSALYVTSMGGPLRVEAHTDRQSALAAMPEQADVDFLALHERWLGRPALSCVDINTRYDDATPATLRQLQCCPGRIALTLSGSVGDCGWDSPDFLLFAHHEAGTARGREMVQVAPATTLTDRADPMFGWCFGLDARQMLPPFTPIGRAEDVGFGVLLSTCFADHYAIHLPWALLHAPPETRSFTTEPAFAVGFNGWLPSVLSDLAPTTGAPADRLAELGRLLQELGRLSEPAFDDFVRQHLLRSLGARAEALDARMTSGPTAWRKDAAAELARMRESALGPVERLYCQPGGREALQRHLVAYGALLGAWPALWAAARALQERGVRPGRRV